MNTNVCVARRMMLMGWKRRLAVTTVISGITAIAPFYAMAADIAPSRDNAEIAQASVIDFNIPAQDLDRALTSLADQAGVRLFFPSGGISGVQASAVQGEMTVDQALGQLLSGTGYTWRFTEDNTVTIEQIAASGETVLDPVRVEANAVTETADGPVDGYVATQSRAATKTDTPIVEVPQMVSVVSREEMEDRGAATLFEAARYSVGVFGEAYGKDPRGYDSFFMRGFENYENGEFRDGLRVTGGNQALYVAEEYGLERVNVLKGSSNTLYGQANIGGIVDSVTKRPNADQKQEVRLQYGDWNHVSGAFDIGGAVVEDETVLFRLVGLASQGNYEYDLANGDEVDKDRIYIAPSFTYAPNGDTKVTILTDYTLDKRGGNYAFVDADGNNVGFMPGEPGYEFYDNEQFTAAVELDHRINDVWQFRQKTRYSSLDVEAGSVFGWQRSGDNIDRYVNYTDNEVRGVVLDNQLQADFETNNIDHTVLMGVDGEYEQNNFRYGGEDYTVSSLNITNPVYAGTTGFTGTYQSQYDFDQTNTEIGLYAQDQMRIADNWLFTLGGRYSNFTREMEYNQTGEKTENTEDAFTTHLALSYEFDNGIVPYVSYAQGFNMNNNVDADGRTFDPEESEQYEAGVKYKPVGLDALFSAAVFQLDKSNAVTYDYGAIAYRQSEEVRSRGIELEAKASLTEAIDVTASYAYTDTEITKSETGDQGNDVPFAPTHIASVWAKYTFNDGVLDGLAVGSGARFTGTYYGDTANDYQTRPRTLIDAVVNYRLNENWLLGVNATNLLDEDYLTNCTQYRCYAGEGRRVIANLTYNW